MDGGSRVDDCGLLECWRWALGDAKPVVSELRMAFLQGADSVKYLMEPGVPACIKALVVLVGCYGTRDR